MPPRLNVLRPRSVALSIRPRGPQLGFSPISQVRFATGDGAQNSKSPKGPNMEQLPHVSEEAAAVNETMGETPPDIEQGTPIKEVLQRDKDAQKNAPQVLKNTTSSTQKRSYSTSTRRNAAEAQLIRHLDFPPSAPARYDETRVFGLEYPDAGPGHKFALPDVDSIPRTDHLRRRYNPVVHAVTRSIMRHGKLSQAQTNMAHILNTLRATPPPQPNAAHGNRNLITTKPRSELPLDPVEYLTTVIDSVAPLIKIRQQRGIAGGGASLPIPVPLGIKQRRRTAIQWILASAENRKDDKLADRVAREIISVAEGKSGAWDKRNLLHRLGVSARTNVRLALMSRRK